MYSYTQGKESHELEDPPQIPPTEGEDEQISARRSESVSKTSDHMK